MNKLLTLVIASMLFFFSFANGYAQQPSARNVSKSATTGKTVAAPTTSPKQGSAASAPASGPISVSAQDATGHLILPNKAPVYPAIAKASRIQGTVVLNAEVDNAGTISNLTIVSGPPMLQQSAMEAVRTWKYRPFQSNGKPVHATFQVNVPYSLGS